MGSAGVRRLKRGWSVKVGHLELSFSRSPANHRTLRLLWEIERFPPRCHFIETSWR
jgi:hypothetical protein